jgi:hypothetical protein
MDEKKKPDKCEQAMWDTLELFDEAGASTKKKKKMGKGGDDEDDYSDDDDDEMEESGAGEQHNIRIKKQKRALRVLMDYSSENRAALTLKEIMDKGKPPPAPQMWMAEVGHEEVGDGLDVLCDSLLLCWRAKPGSLVAFFSLEMSGPLGSKEQQNNEFKEIYRDPPDADSEAEFKNWVTEFGGNRLLPNTTYSFRIRAFNGFGGGPYIRKDFTTQPAAPPNPVLVKASTNTVTIRWKFGTKTAQMFDALKKIHSELGAGAERVSRNAFLEALEGQGDGDLRLSSHPFLGLRSVTLGAGDCNVFDAIEGHADDNIYMGEIER